MSAIGLETRSALQQPYLLRRGRSVPNYEVTVMPGGCQASCASLLPARPAICRSRGVVRVVELVGPCLQALDDCECAGADREGALLKTTDFGRRTCRDRAPQDSWEESSCVGGLERGRRGRGRGSYGRLGAPSRSPLMGMDVGCCKGRRELEGCSLSRALGSSLRDVRFLFATEPRSDSGFPHWEHKPTTGMVRLRAVERERRGHEPSGITGDASCFIMEPPGSQGSTARLDPGVPDAPGMARRASRPPTLPSRSSRGVGAAPPLLLRSDTGVGERGNVDEAVKELGMAAAVPASPHAQVEAWWARGRVWPWTMPG